MKVLRGLSWMPRTIEARLLLLAVSAPVLILPERFPRYLVIILASACFALVILDSSLRRNRLPLWLLLLLIIPSLTGSLAFSVNGAASFGKICLMALSFATFQVLTSAQAKDRLRLVKLVTSLLVAGILMLSMFGPFFLQLVPNLEILGVNPWGNRVWTLPEDIHKNTLGGLLTIGFLLSLAFAVGALRRRRWVGVLPATLTGIMLLIMQSRASIAVSLIVGVVLLGGLIRKRWLSYLLSLPVAAFLWWAYTAFFERRPTEVFTRLELWDRSLAALRGLPVTGIGTGAFREVMPLLYPFFSFDPEGIPGHAHNLFLQVALDVGFPGFVAVFAIVFGVLFTGWRQMRVMRENQDPLYIFLAGYIAALVSVVLHGVVDSPLWLNKPHPVIFGLAGVIVLMTSISSRGRPPRPALVGAFIFFLWLGVTLSAVSLADASPLFSLLTAIAGSIGLGVWAAALQAPTPKQPSSPPGGAETSIR